MLRPKIILFFLLICTLPSFIYSQENDNNHFYKDFERNYDSLLNSFYMRKNKNNIISSQSKKVNSRFIPASSLSDSVLKRRLDRIPSSIPLTYNQNVRNIIEFYIDKITDRSAVMIGLSEYYFPIFESILDQYNAPHELKYLAVIESALNPNAVSRVGATGLWQFMYATGKMYDLRVNSVIDDRKDPIKSSVAAARYLRDLNRIYNDWELALAAYNCGPGNVNKAIRRSGKKSFWEIYDFLPRETRGYVPAYIAATYVMNYYKEHGITPVKLSKPINTDTVMVSKNIDLEILSSVLGLPLEEIKDINPQYKQNTIPGAHDSYSLKLPLIYINQYIALEDSISRAACSNENNIKSYEYVEKNITYKVRRGDTWTSIARKHGVSISDIKRWNKVSKYPNIGQNISIKKKVEVEVTKKESPFEESNPSVVENTSEKEKTITKPKPQQQKAKTYKVRKGDTLFKISQRYGLTVNEIIRLNNFKSKNPVIKPGQTLIIG